MSVQFWLEALKQMKNEKLKIKNDFRTEVSAGCVVFKKSIINHQSSAILFALGKHSGYHKWVLPKGLVEKGENKLQAAVRETEEELGIKVKIIDEKPVYAAKYNYWAELKRNNSNIQTPNSKQVQNSKLENQNESTRRVKRYQESFDSALDKSGGGKTKIAKTVYFYLGEYLSGDIAKHGWEMEDAGWFEYEKALKLMAFNDEKMAVKNTYLLKK